MTTLAFNTDTLEFQGCSYAIVAVMRSGFERSVVVLAKRPVKIGGDLYAAVIQYKNDSYCFLSEPLSIKELETKMDHILQGIANGPVSSEAFAMASGMCLACFQIQEMVDDQTSQVSPA